LQEPLLRFWVEESDMSSAAVGKPINVIFEAMPDDTFEGEIIRVDPVLVTVDGTSAVQILGRLDLDVETVDLLVGMTAEVEIVSAETRDAVLVPVEALHETSPENYAVFVVNSNGELEMRAVTIGLQDVMNAEVLTGLEVGETVSIGEVQ
jgi:multidrug efflux pump subunit AcrA (membrane-fusion protein)